MRNVRNIALALGVTLAILITVGVTNPERAAAQAMDTFGMGSRNTAMGGAVTAHVSDPTSAFYNPAGLAGADGLQLHVGYFYAMPKLELDGADSQVDDISGIVFGLQVPGRIGGVNIAFGLAGHLPDGRVSRSRSLPRRQPRWEMYDNRPHRTLLTASLAVAPTEWLRIGGGLGFQAYSINELSLAGDLGIVGRESETNLIQEVELALKSIRYPVAGVQVLPTDWLSFGVTYRGEYALSSDLIAEVAADLLGPPVDPFAAYVFIDTMSTNAFVPRQLSFGATTTILGKLMLSAELTWVQWSRYKSAIGDSFVELSIDVPPELEDIINVPDSITPGVSIPAEFQDRFVPRFGAEYTHDFSESFALSGRLGYVFEDSPAPPQTGYTNLVDANRHVFSVGVGTKLGMFRPLLPGWVDLDVHFQWSHLPARDHQKQSPADPIGDYRAAGNIYALGASLQVSFD